MAHSIIGYARTSTADQVAGLDAQKRDLEAAGCARIFAEQVSSVAEREQLTRAIDACETGDILMVTKPDRLARSTIGMLKIVEDLNDRGVGLIVLSMNGERLDTRNPSSKLMLTILAAVAAWERETMLERQKEGILKAKADGKYKGRKPTATSLVDSVVLLADRGTTRAAIVIETGTSLATVKRILRAHKMLKSRNYSQTEAMPGGVLVSD